MTNEELIEQIKELSLIELRDLKDKVYRLHYDKQNKCLEENIRQLKKEALESGLIEKLKPAVVELKNARVKFQFFEQYYESTESKPMICSYQVHHVDNVDTDPNFIAAREAYQQALDELKALIVKFDSPVSVTGLINELVHE
jgi:hypothetical protein